MSVIVDMQKIFSQIYRDNKWGYLSGDGSISSLNTPYVEFLENFLREKKIRSVVDLGCGDFRLSGEIFINKSHIRYTGVDCVLPLISFLSKIHNAKKHIHFECYDLFKMRDQIPCAYLFILKDVLQHWTNRHIKDFLDFLVSSRKARYILITNHCGQKGDDEDISSVGEFHPLSAYHFPLKRYNPQIVLKYQGKETSLWKL